MGLRINSHTKIIANASNPANDPSRAKWLPVSEKIGTPIVSAPASTKFTETARDMPASRCTEGNTSDAYMNGTTWIKLTLCSPQAYGKDLTYTSTRAVCRRVYQDHSYYCSCGWRFIISNVEKLSRSNEEREHQA